MSDMRLIVAGAGGRMGRTLVKAIADTHGLELAGAVEDGALAADRPGCRQLAGLGENGVKLVGDAAPLLAQADGHRRLHHAGRDPRPGRHSPPRRARCMSSAPPA